MIDGVESESTGEVPQAPQPDGRVVHQLSVGQHVRLTQVVLRDQTDGCNELAQPRQWLLHRCERLALPGNLFVFDDVLAGRQRMLIKRSPLPAARPASIPADIRVRPGKAGGFEVDLLAAADEPDDVFVELECGPGALARTRALHAYQQSQRPRTVEHATPTLLSNTWGDRSRDGRICQEFVEREIKAAAALGVDIVQIDDGWQKGATANSVQADGVWAGFWAADEQFWTPHPERFPNGLGPVAEAARRHGVQLGLWFGPDSANDFANWRRDADMLLGLRRELGVGSFKLDSIKAPTAAAFANLAKLFEAVRAGSDGRIVMDLDITAGQRPGYFGAMDVGPLFVENRYTDWHRYWPHHTLRNLWMLSHWIDPRRLRMEFLNPDRNTDRYVDDPLAPVAYAPDTLFATVMFANPLAWLEVSNLPADCTAKMADLIAIWRQHREAIFAGTILPIGAAPDGVSWTGFAAIAPDIASAYVLAFRELSAEAVCELRVPGLTGGKRCDILAGTGEASAADGIIRVAVTDPLGHVLARVW